MVLEESLEDPQPPAIDEQNAATGAAPSDACCPSTNQSSSSSNNDASSSSSSSSSSNCPPPAEQSSTSSSCDSKFKCNICFETPVDPVVTVCGHMYCWKCLLVWIDQGSGQCPVCKAGVTKLNVIPVYGSGIESASSTPHPASKEGQQEAEKRQQETDEGRPRAERPEAPPQPYRRGGWHSTSGGVQFGFFPFGVGVQFGGNGFVGGRNRPQTLTREQQRSQFISAALIVFGVVVIFWAAFVEPLFLQEF